jgi:hypothetical protein
MSEAMSYPLPGAGIYERALRREDFARLFSDFLDTKVYSQLPSEQHRLIAFDREYEDNGQFWSDALAFEHHDGERIRLRNFTLLEWVPLSPGRFHTREAAEQRDRARKMFEYRNGQMEYIPLGKAGMILGGVGSIRLGSRQDGGSAIRVLSASSTGVSHEGIPIMVDEKKLSPLLKQVRDNGALVVDALGTLRSTRFSDWRIRQTPGVPTMFLSLDDVTVNGPAEEALATISIMYSCGYHSATERETFSGNGFTTNLEKSWSFASFDPREGPAAIQHSVKWLSEYAKAYSGMQNAPIFGDFDEQYAWFEEPVEFTLADVAAGTCDPGRIMAYARYYGMTINIKEFVMGDSFSTISNTTIISRSVVTNSLNRAESQNQEVKKAILEVVDFINRSGSREAGEQFETFVEEASKSSPKKSVLASLWNGTVAALPAISQLAGVAETIHKLF